MITTDDRKYSFVVCENLIKNTVQIKILRFGEDWWNDSNPVFPWKAIHSLIVKAERQENIIKELTQALLAHSVSLIVDKEV